MAPVQRINLIKTAENQNPQVYAAVQLLKKISGISVSIVGGLVVLIGILYIVFLTTTQNQTAQKQTLVASITQDTTKEGLLLAVKQRAAVVAKITSAKRNFASLFDLMAKVAPASAITSISMDDNNKVVVTLRTDSIIQTVTAVDALLASVTAGQANKPALESLTLAKQGGFEMKLSFVPIL